ncbi:MAG: LemA protein [Parcubacteria group bacterium Gr01-1014_2]|nr:MAG: LemA protein [Parcubacteria group bacterium Gr01-1014_2]
MGILTVVLIIVAVLIVWLIGTFNVLVVRRNRVKESWSDIEVQLKRRYDLIPNLVNIVKGYAAHERGVFEEVTQARSMAIGAKTPEEHSKAENILTGALKHLFAVAEAYPQLRASENFRELQMELSDTENKIQAARRFYNSTVLDLNTSIEQFPTNLVAGMFGFKKGEFFDLENELEHQSVKVQF